MEDLTEACLETEELFEGRLLHVFRDRVQLPDGGESSREWIDHPGASAVVPLFDDGSTMLVRQFRYPAKRTFLEVPAGKIDVKGEDPAEVAARELEEETGWCAHTYTGLGSLYPCIGYSNEVIHFYLAEGLEKGRQELSDEEFVELVPMGFDEALERVANGEIDDMKTVVALMRARAHLDHSERELAGKKLR